MTDRAKAARGIALAIVVVCVAAFDAVTEAWQARLDELTAADMARMEWEYQQSGAAEAAEAMVLWQMKLEGRCAPNVIKAAAIPCGPADQIKLPVMDRLKERQ